MEEIQKIIKQIENKSFAPIYILMGEEPYYIDKITNSLLEHVLTEDEKAFNLDIVYGKDADMNQVVGMAKQFPMMADYRMVLVKEAQDVKELDPLTSYLEQVQPQTILVINHKYKNIDSRTELGKKIGKHPDVVIVKSEKIRDYQVPNVIKKIVEAQNRTIGTKATAMLDEFLGNDLGKIENEIGKLCILVPEGQEITDEVIEKNIGISKDFNNFEFIKAIAQKDQVKAYKIAKYFYNNPKNNPPILTISLLYNFFSTLVQFQGIKHKEPYKTSQEIATKIGKRSAYALKDQETASKYYTLKQTSRNLDYLKELDLRIKGVNSSGGVGYYDLLSEFLAKVFN
ncbi:DNA polymerase III subunit delta [Capnocytophaga sp. ARDL2]|uniref:DNA polymerase III subunit delta n=1 Tax=Capnocytophaga sp. ARDL2 TaxID=3238809 RepID=UPI0035587D11